MEPILFWVGEKNFNGINGHDIGKKQMIVLRVREVGIYQNEQGDVTRVYRNKRSVVFYTTMIESEKIITASLSQFRDLDEAAENWFHFELLNMNVTDEAFASELNEWRKRWLSESIL